MLKLKKTLAAVMAVIMIGTMMLSAVFTANAKDFSDVSPDNAFSAQIDMLSDIGVIKGTSDTEFSPNAKVSREQMALLLYRLMTGKDNSGRVNTSPFTDLYEPAYNGAISWAAANGYILGTTSTTFDPKGGITLQDALALLTRALGQTNDKTNAGYPWSFIDIGNRLGLTEELHDIPYDKTLTRAETAALVYNAITADYIITRTVSGTTIPVVTTILRYVYGYESGTAVITASNNFALPGASTVIRDGFVRMNVTDADGNSEGAFVKATDLGIYGNVDFRLGESFDVFYSIDRNGIASILGATESGYTKSINSFKVGDGNSYVELDGIRYNVVEQYSGSSATNANEIKVFAFDSDGTLSVVRDNASLAAMNGFFSMKLIFDGDDSRADRAIITPLTHAELDITSAGEINIAGGNKASELTGGFFNIANASDGDRVLYYYNSVAKRLIIEEKLFAVKNVKVTRLSADSAVVGGITYSLGVEGTAFDSAFVLAKLSVGDKVDILVRGNAIVDASAASTGETVFDSTYLIATSTVTPVVHKDRVCYFVTANIGGKSVNVYVTNSSVDVNGIYRYETDKDGILTLIGASDEKFAQKDELKAVINGASSVKIEKNGNVYYTLTNGSSSHRFITDKDTVIVVKTSAGFVYKTGAYASTLTVNDGANVVAVMKDSVGSVETLRYLYISDGVLGSAVDSASFVKILARTATEQVNGVAMNVYTVYNFITGKIDTRYSMSDALIVGTAYLLDESGHITTSVKSIESGTVNGYAGNTVTIGDKTFTLAEGVLIAEVEASASGEHTVKNLTASELFGKTVSFIADGNTVSRILVTG